MLKLPTRTNQSINITLPAPLKGLNVRDSLADMEMDYAVTMDNYLPLDTKVALRPGYVLYEETDDAVATLAPYQKGTDLRFFAIAGHTVYDISSRNQKTPVAGVSFMQPHCQTVQYKNHLYFVNGIDTPKVFYIDDNNVEHFENWQFSAENLNPASIINVAVSKQRLWFVEKNSMRVWYPEVAGNISGTLQCFDLSQVSRFGGHLVAVANWTQDGGQGIDDLTVFITSEGEALVYAGINVNNADDWKLRGSYKVSKPIGYQCLVAYQGDVVIISEDGYIPLSKALPVDCISASSLAFSDAIRGLVLNRSAYYSRLNGWHGIIYNRGGYAIFNVPVANQFEQHVINLNTGAWCRFTNIRALCWQIFDGRIYFGSDNGVYLFDEGYSDNGMPISGTVEQAFSNLGCESLKKMLLINPRTKAAKQYNLVIYLNTDMQKQNVEYAENIGNGNTTKWNKIKWSSLQRPIASKWGYSGSNIMQSQWIAVAATGYKVSIVFKTKTNGNFIEWFETGIRYAVGSGVL